MATNGWYVKQIITDLQEGKVDEFVKKEGKWFNYLKGETTTFTNAADAGSASGNLDFEEFSIQGVGTISGTPSVSGTTPVLGTDIIVNVSGGSNWTSTGYLGYNLPVHPSTIAAPTFVINPTAGYAIAASQFSFTSASYSSAASDWISSITFTDSGEAFNPSNTVIGTINFATDSGGGGTSFLPAMSSGVEYIATITLDTAAVVSGVTWQGTLSFVSNTSFTQNDDGAFESNSFNTNAYVNPDTIVFLGSFPTMKEYSASIQIVPEVSSTLLDVTFFGSGGVFYNTTSLPQVQIVVPDSELEQYNVILNDGVSNGINTRRVIIEYTPANGVFIDNDNHIQINTMSSLGSIEFDPTTAHPGELQGSMQLPVINNLGPFTAAASFPDGTTPWFTLGLVDDDMSTPQFVTVEYETNDGVTAVSRSGSVAITSDTTLPGFAADSTCTLIQTVAPHVEVIGHRLFPDDYAGTSFGDYVSSFTNIVGGVNNSLPASCPLGFQLTVITESDTSDIQAGSWILIDDNTGNSFDSDGNGVGVEWFINFTPEVGTGTFGVAWAWNINANIYDNTTSSERSATFYYTHPDSPLTGSFQITQDGGFVAETNTFDFWSATETTNASGDTTIIASLSTTVNAVSGDEVIGTKTVNYEAQSFELYAAIPETDTVQDGSINDITVTDNFGDPGGGGYVGQYFVNGLDEDNSMLDNDGLNNYFVSSWLSSLTTEYIAPGEALVGNFGINYVVNITINQNYNVLGNGTDMLGTTWQRRWPVDRTFTLSGFNPYSEGDYGTSGPAGDFINIKQTAAPAAEFTGVAGYSDESGGEYQIDETYSASDGVNLTCRATSSTPYVNVYHPEQTIGGVTVDEFIGFNDFITGATVTSNASFDGYDIALTVTENNTGEAREAQLGLWHSSLDSTDITTLGTPNGLSWPLSGNDLITITQEPVADSLQLLYSAAYDAAVSYMQNATGVGNWINTFIINAGIDDGPDYLVAQHSSIEFDLQYNGADPVFGDYTFSSNLEGYREYSIASIVAGVVMPGFTAGPPPWITSKTINGTTNKLTFNVDHSSPATADSIREYKIFILSGDGGEEPFVKLTMKIFY